MTTLTTSTSTARPVRRGGQNAARGYRPPAWLGYAFISPAMIFFLVFIAGPFVVAIALAFFHGLSHGELAAHLREPLGTVKSWVRRGLAKLRRCLDEAVAVR